VEESRDRLTAMGIDQSKIAIVSNTPDMRGVTIQPDTIPRSWQGRKILLYEGFLTKSRGLQTVIEAVPAISRQFPDILFAVIGTGNYRTVLETLARQLNVEKYVEFLGWVDNHLIPSHVDASYACLIPHLRSPHKDTTIPNKLFDYMAVGKPVITTDALPLARIVNDEQCGVAYQSGNAAAFSRAASMLLQGAEHARLLGLNGRAAYARIYNWERDAGKLLEVVESATC